MENFDLIVIGGGAAGFYGAIQAADIRPGFRILILEKSTKLLSKVRISGGGRCNVTHHCFDPISLSHHYPRGEKPLRNVFRSRCRPIPARKKGTNSSVAPCVKSVTLAQLFRPKPYLRRRHPRLPPLQRKPPSLEVRKAESWPMQIQPQPPACFPASSVQLCPWPGCPKVRSFTVFCSCNLAGCSNSSRL